MDTPLRQGPLARFKVIDCRACVPDQLRCGSLPIGALKSSRSNRRKVMQGWGASGMGRTSKTCTATNAA